ncbi:hypothetical protein NDU88_004834 [Pleurodeles waltl]|uniref:Uncharacterized protein n=1 Tax=Pleurodeles waltl TaxID=8319 RepID=A0AAV7WZG1_PLEWA|nr:hypothetical protein NDU88_004834 [Pleurodeles waltl]
MDRRRPESSPVDSEPLREQQPLREPLRTLLLAVLLVVQVLHLDGQRGEQAAQLMACREAEDVVGREQLQLLSVELQ